MQYKVVCTVTPTSLEVEIAELLKQGWRLQGGVSITSHGMTVYLAQALVK